MWKEVGEIGTQVCKSYMYSKVSYQFRLAHCETSESSLETKFLSHENHWSGNFNGWNLISQWLRNEMTTKQQNKSYNKSILISALTLTVSNKKLSMSISSNWCLYQAGEARSQYFSIEKSLLEPKYMYNLGMFQSQQKSSSEKFAWVKMMLSVRNQSNRKQYKADMINSQ